RVAREGVERAAGRERYRSFVGRAELRPAELQEVRRAAVVVALGRERRAEERVERALVLRLVLREIGEAACEELARGRAGALLREDGLALRRPRGLGRREDDPELPRGPDGIEVRRGPGEEGGVQRARGFEVAGARPRAGGPVHGA